MSVVIRKIIIMELSANGRRRERCAKVGGRLNVRHNAMAGKEGKG